MSAHGSVTRDGARHAGSIEAGQATDDDAPMGRGSHGRWGQLLSVLVVLALWQLVSLRFPPVLLPGPTDLVGYLASISASGELATSVATTMFHLAITTVLVVPAATLVGFVMGRRRVIEALGAPWVPFLQTVPDLIVIAFALIVFGLGSFGVVFVAFVISTPFMVVSVWTGVRGVDADLLQMAKAFQASDWRVLREIVIPHALPYLLSGSRIAIGIAWHVIIFAEYLMMNVGAGAQIKAAADAFDNVAVFSWGLVVVTIMLVIEYALLKPLERMVRARLGVSGEHTDAASTARLAKRAGVA